MAAAGLWSWSAASLTAIGPIPQLIVLPPANRSAAVSPMGGEGRRTRTTAGRDPAYALQGVPRDAPEPPSTANGRQQQQLVNVKLARALGPGEQRT